jgi:hypothetical protein
MSNNKSVLPVVICWKQTRARIVTERSSLSWLIWFNILIKSSCRLFSEWIKNVYKFIIIKSDCRKAWQNEKEEEEHFSRWNVEKTDLWKFQNFSSHFFPSSSPSSQQQQQHLRLHKVPFWVKSMERHKNILVGNYWKTWTNYTDWNKIIKTFFFALSLPFSLSLSLLFGHPSKARVCFATRGWVRDI